MDIFPIACESLGTRSFAHFVITENVNILIDPSVSLGPIRFRLLPHPLEVAVSWISRQTILKLIDLADVLIQTHYHGDHFTLNEKRIYEFTNKEVFNKTYIPRLTILAKDPENNLNFNQQRRAKWLWNNKELNLKIADNREFSLGSTRIQFSPAVYHGFDSKRGYVVETLIQDSSQSYLYTSDVCGPASKEALKFILDSNPDIIVLDGPSSYHQNASEEEKTSAFDNLSEVTDNYSRVFIDHHFLRSLDWENILKKKLGKTLPAFSQISHQEPFLLEAKRKSLYKQIEFPKDFHSKFQYSGYPEEYFEKLLTESGYGKYWKKVFENIKSKILTK